MMNVWSGTKDLADLDYDTWSQWKLNVELFLGLMDMDTALLEDKPAKPDETYTTNSSAEEKSKYQKWERSNRMCLLLMKSKMSSCIRSFVPASDDAKEYFAGVEAMVMKVEKDSKKFLMSKLLGMKYEGAAEGGSCSMVEHILTMYGLYIRLNADGTRLSEEFLLEFVKYSLNLESIDTWKEKEKEKENKNEKWDLKELVSWCWRWEKYVVQDNKANAGSKRRRLG